MMSVGRVRARVRLRETWVGVLREDFRIKVVSREDTRDWAAWRAGTVDHS